MLMQYNTIYFPILINIDYPGLEKINIMGFIVEKVTNNNSKIDKSCLLPCCLQATRSLIFEKIFFFQKNIS